MKKYNLQIKIYNIKKNKKNTFKHYFVYMTFTFLSKMTFFFFHGSSGFNFDYPKVQKQWRYRRHFKSTIYVVFRDAKSSGFVNILEKNTKMNKKILPVST